MIKIFGKVPNDDPTNGAISELQECIDECFYTPDCILSYMDSNNHCLMYNYSTTTILNVIETTRADGLYVAFKVNLDPGTCPATYQSIEYCGSAGPDSFCWNRTATNWVITNQCVDPWKKFVRDDGVKVCLKGVKGAYGITKSQAMTLCESEGYKLTGVASVNESVWMEQQIVKLNSNAGAFWLDGVRTPECTANKCNIFDWSDGYTTGNNALNASNADLSFISGTLIENCLTSFVGGNGDVLNDVSCDTYAIASGYFCGFQMMN